ncbi:aldo-keto reductase family 1 member B1-like [Diadema antillarum]|uniref:aldo-keto reductase family 1 member B1-like n=1 Tax=Diadema antillarum TaxID=105358 RepID=UPI003A895AAB
MINRAIAQFLSFIRTRQYSVMASANKYVDLPNGKKMPILGLGTWKSPAEKVTEAVKVAIDAGYRHIDCAHVYGNEVAVGAAINAKIEENVVTREDLFVTSKLWNTMHHPDDVRGACEETLKNLNLSYIDLYLIHWPMAYKRGKEMFPKDENGKFIPADIDYVDTYLAMEKLVADGLCKSIGLSNFSAKMIKRVLEKASVPPANHQVELHPYLTQEKLVSFCKENNIIVTAYSPLGSPDRPWVKDDDPNLMQDPVVKDIAKKRGKSEAQILIRFALDRGIICIPKSVTPAYIRANFEALNFELSPDDMKQLMDLNTGYRGCGLEWVSHRQHPFSGEERDEE